MYNKKQYELHVEKKVIFSNAHLFKWEAISE